MSSPSALKVRSEFEPDVVWAEVSPELKRYELWTPDVPGSIERIPRTVGCVHGPRSSLIVRIGGGHLRAPSEALLSRLVDEASPRLSAVSLGPADHARQVVGWLESEQRAGFLERTYTTASLLIAVSDHEIWAWLTCPHGVAHGSLESFVFDSTDLRYPVLRRLGAMKQAPFRYPGMDMADKASSVSCIGAPDVYESIRVRLDASELLIGFDRATLPFDPWPPDVSLTRLWQMDAAWKHGLAGVVVAIGKPAIEDIAPPENWKVKAVPF